MQFNVIRFIVRRLLSKTRNMFNLQTIMFNIR